MSNKYINHRIHIREHNGQFRRATLRDIGILGTCRCGNPLVRHYGGDPADPHPDPRKFRARCFHCEPLAEEKPAVTQDVKGFFLGGK